MNNRDFERERKMLAEEMYLNYFNNYLYNQGVISKRDRDKMAIEIMHRKPLTKKQPPRSYEMEL